MNASYESVTEYKNSRITDHLILNYIKGEKSWKKGEVISEVTYVIEAE